MAIYYHLLMTGKKFKSVLIWGIAILGYYMWFQSFYNVMRFGAVFPYPDFKAAMLGIANNLPPVILECLLNLFVIFHLVRIKDLRAKICLDMILSIAGVVIVNWLYTWISGKDVEDWAGTVLADIIIFFGIEVVYYFRRLSRMREEMEEARRQALQYRYDALKAQINPHFLFNSLNLLNSLISIDTQRSKKFIHELSRMYRYIMSQHNRETVSVAEEFDFLASYVSILEMRYNNKFSVVLHGTPEARRRIIPFTMQLLLENVTKHNAITAQPPMVVDITVDSNGITVTNPVHPRENVSANHFGLQYLSQLYASHKKEFTAQKTEQHFTAYVPYL